MMAAWSKTLDEQIGDQQALRLLDTLWCPGPMAESGLIRESFGIPSGSHATT